MEGARKCVDDERHHDNDVQAQGEEQHARSSPEFTPLKMRFRGIHVQCHLTHGFSRFGRKVATP